MSYHSKKLLIASSSLDEAITSCVLENKHTFSMPIDLVCIEEILHDFNIYDELSDEHAIVRWFKDKTVISNQSHVLLNRVLGFPDHLFSSFVQTDRAYAQREFEAYLGYSFNAFKGVGNQTFNGLCESAFSLPEQWQRMQKHCQVPHYHWGPFEVCTLKSTERRVYSNIYDTLNWSPETPKPDTTHGFCFEKPQGAPVFVFTLGEKSLICTSQTLSFTVKKQLLKQIQTIRHIFRYFMFETLFFLHKDKLSFGCVNYALIRTPKHEHFKPFVLRHLLPEYLKCLH